MRRILLILTILGLAGGAVWYFVLRPRGTPTEQPGGGFKEFFSFGGENDENTGQNQIPLPNEQIIPSATSSSFKQITALPVAGYTVFSQTKTITTPPSTPNGKPGVQTIIENIIRYVSRQSGFVYEIKNETAPLQISNIFIPAIYEAYFADNNTTAILRFIKDGTNTIGTYSVPIPSENPDGTRTQKEGAFLLDNTLGIAISPDTKEVVKLNVEQTQGVFTIASSLDKNKKEILRTPLKEWSISWPQKGSIYAQTKPAGIVEGFLYKIDTTEKRLRRVIGNVKGLTASVSPNGSFVLYSETTKDGFITKIMNTKTGSIKNTNLAILPEKCVWLKSEDLICAGNTDVPAGVYPDAWYAGLVSFSDQIFRIYTANNIFDVLYSNNEESFDMTSLQADENRGLLFFIDKKTGLLWSFTL